ncbi:unnamed protein product [Microthlaspi erraticum]|uniref:Reverse transcriptase zinc-binding domain-containing protein n=1 Tax=Microthlaspi erraticum TaxID=1685480 RepID=A0A6D2I794_9BRAS|nr:unnamed protein product [Microthlaspi erraticum]
MSGLGVNIQKTSMFCQGIDSATLDRIHALFNLKASSLPIRYLGLPLSSKKLSVGDCDPLIVQIKQKLDSWNNRLLSLAGRLSLLSSVISGIIGFWTSAFILPLKVIKRINSLSSSFLWHGKTGNSSGAKVAWRDLSYPKSEGGLGLRDIASWNNACALKLIWMLFFRADSIWVAWIRNRYLSSSFWALNDKNYAYSWMFRKILKLRSKAIQFLSIKVRNGDSTLFWWDPWTPFGSLFTYLGEDGPSRLGIPLNATVVWSGTGWNLPPARTERQVALHSFLLTIGCSNSNDVSLWSVNGRASKSFLLKEVWNETRCKKPEIPWASLLWHKAGLARHQITTWLFLLNRNPTMDRMSSWGFEMEGTCLLCGANRETRDHLFFECPFSAFVWERLMIQLDLCIVPMSWMNLLYWLQVASLDNTLRLAVLQGWQGAVYEIWREHNRRLHDGVTLSQGKVFRIIISFVMDKCRALALRFFKWRFDSSKVVSF